MATRTIASLAHMWKGYYPSFSRTDLSTIYFQIGELGLCVATIAGVSIVDPIFNKTRAGAHQHSGATAMLTAAAIMNSNMVTVDPDASIEQAIEMLLEQQISGLPVVDSDGRLVGLITEFALLAVAYDRHVKNHKVSQHMTCDVIAVDVDDPISRVADLCIVHRVRRVLVIQGGRLVGVIARRDVLRALVDSPVGAAMT